MDDKPSFAEKFAKKNVLDELKSKKIGDKPATKSETESEDSALLKRDKNSFMDHLISSRKDLCYKVSGVDITGREAWYFVLIDKDRVESFLKHKKGDSYNLEDYGKIIVSGYGDEVPEEVKEMLREKYDFDNF